eukprot:gene10326-11397_t
MAELEEKGTGYTDEYITLKPYFAEDALLLSHSIDEAKENLDIITQVSRRYGLEINKDKPDVMIFNMKDQPELINDIKVVSMIKYLGIEIDNRQNYFKPTKKQ